MTKWIAQAEFDCVPVKGRRFRLTAKIAEPAVVPREGKLSAYGRCRVSLEPLMQERNIGGVDKFQALCLSIDFIRTVLKTFAAQGGHVLFPETETPIQLDNPSFCPYPDIGLLQRKSKKAKASKPNKATQAKARKLADPDR
jgi:hypothetical protein